MKLNPAKEECERIKKSLTEFNNANVGEDGHAELNLAEYDDEGALIGGLLGGTYWGWLYVDFLWVEEDCRRQGLGSRLLEAAEQEARRRGCHHVYLDTMSWQAPLFYQKHGYRMIGTLPDIPRGNRKFLFMKEL